MSDGSIKPDGGTAHDCFERTNGSDIATDERRTAKRRENAALPQRLTGNRLVDHGPQPRGIRPVFRQPSRERSDEIAVAVEPENFEPGHSALVEPISIASDRALLRLAAHKAPQQISINITRLEVDRKG